MGHKALKQLAWMAAAGLLATGAAAAQSSPSQPGLSLDQAVTQVQQRVGGKVLSAEPRHIGRKVEYRIKVLTPEGHVRVIAVPSDATHVPPAAQSSPKKSPNGGSKKEKH
ncbi:hypothetical protein [Dyella sp.]|uniref:PepSY domain-containing protein n=1 Tax=Dyella sp. TaxID=1869338 RepID=UPI002D77992A|nr:hypothetical protein [Dyella sp.]HET7330922.1 hypothetical protein [Dyella sp.]